MANPIEDTYHEAMSAQLYPLHALACRACGYDEQTSQRVLRMALRAFHSVEFAPYATVLQSLFASCYFWRAYMPNAFEALLPSSKSLDDKDGWHAFSAVVRSIMIWLAPVENAPDTRVEHGVYVQSRAMERPFARALTEEHANAWCHAVLLEVGRGKVSVEVWAPVLYAFFFVAPCQELWDFNHFTRARSHDGMEIPGMDWAHDWTRLFADMTSELADAVGHFDLFFLYMQREYPASTYIVPKSVLRTNAPRGFSQVSGPKPYDIVLQFPYARLRLTCARDPTLQYVGRADEKRNVVSFVSRRPFRRPGKYAPLNTHEELELPNTVDVYASVLHCDDPRVLAMCMARIMREYGVPPFVLSFMLEAHGYDPENEDDDKCVTVCDPYDGAVAGHIYHAAPEMVSNGVMECWPCEAFWNEFLHPLQDESLQALWEQRGEREAREVPRYGLSVDGACAYMFASQLRVNETDRRGQVRMMLREQISDKEELTFTFRVCLRIHPVVWQHMDRDNVDDPLTEVFENLEYESARHFAMKSNLSQA